MSGLSRILLMAVCAQVIGCGAAGRLERVQPAADGERPGSTYMIRGLLGGSWSRGLDELAETLSEHGVHAEVFRREQARDLGDAIVATYAAAPNHEPLILIGHSYGADSAIRILHQLDEAEVQVDLLITLDATNPQPVPGNVRRVVNIYRSSGWRDRLPFFRGLALVAESEGHDTMLVNIDVRDDAELSRRRINHFTIDRDPHVQELILAEVLDCCRQQRSAPDHAE